MHLWGNGHFYVGWLIITAITCFVYFTLQTVIVLAFNTSNNVLTFYIRISQFFQSCAEKLTLIVLVSTRAAIFLLLLLHVVFPNLMLCPQTLKRTAKHI